MLHLLIKNSLKCGGFALKGSLQSLSLLVWFQTRQVQTIDDRLISIAGLPN